MFPGYAGRKLEPVSFSGPRRHCLRSGGARELSRPKACLVRRPPNRWMMSRITPCSPRPGYWRDFGLISNTDSWCSRFRCIRAAAIISLLPSPNIHLTRLVTLPDAASPWEVSTHCTPWPRRSRSCWGIHSDIGGHALDAHGISNARVGSSQVVCLTRRSCSLMFLSSYSRLCHMTPNICFRVGRAASSQGQLERLIIDASRVSQIAPPPTPGKA